MSGDAPVWPDEATVERAVVMVPMPPDLAEHWAAWPGPEGTPGHRTSEACQIGLRAAELQALLDESGECEARSGYHSDGDPMLCTLPDGHDGWHDHWGYFQWPPGSLATDQLSGGGGSRQVITNDSGDVGARLVGLGPHSPDELATAAQMILDSPWHAADDCTPASIVAESRVVILREHVAAPSMELCGCDDVGWFCDQADGERSAWLWWATP